MAKDEKPGRFVRRRGRSSRELFSDVDAPATDDDWLAAMQEDVASDEAENAAYYSGGGSRPGRAALAAAVVALAEEMVRMDDRLSKVEEALGQEPLASEAREVLARAKKASASGGQRRRRTGAQRPKKDPG